MDVSTPNHAELNAGVRIIEKNDGKSHGSGGNSNNAGNAGSSGNAGVVGIADMSRPPRAPIHGLALDPFDASTGTQSPVPPSQTSESHTAYSEPGAASDSEQGGRGASKRSRTSAAASITSATYSNASAGSAESFADNSLDSGQGPGPDRDRSRMASRSNGSRSEGEDYSQSMDMGEFGTCVCCLLFGDWCLYCFFWGLLPLSTANLLPFPPPRFLPFPPSAFYRPPLLLLPPILPALRADDDGTTGYDADLCLAGSEQTGRWTRKEHELFLDALKKYGKEWKKVASAVKTRTVVQTRTHAQKYFQKVHKSGFGSGYSDDDGAFDGPSIGSTARSSGGSSRRISKRARRPKLPSSMPMGYVHLNNPHSAYQGSDMDDDYDDDEGVGAMEMLSGGHSSFASTPILAKKHGGISLSVPMGMSLGMNDDYPQPSPAACGKRKEAELTAAKMLASHSASRDMEGANALSSLKAAAYRPGEIVRRQRVNLPMLSIVDPDMVPGSGSSKGDDGTAPGTPWEKEVRELGEQKVSGVPYKGMAPLPVGTPSQQKEFLVKVRQHIMSGDVVNLAKTLVAAEASTSSSATPSSVLPIPLTDIFAAGTSTDNAPPGSAAGAGVGGESSPRAQQHTSGFSSDSKIKTEAKAPGSPAPPSPQSKGGGGGGGKSGAAGSGSSASSSVASFATASASKPTASLIARTLNRLSSSGLEVLGEASGTGNDIKAAARTALMLACSLPSSADMVQATPSAAAASICSPGAKASSAMTATATSNGFTQDVVLALCRTLIDHGASPTIVGPQGESCLHLVAKRGWERVGRLLLNRGCPVNAIGPDGNAAVHLAVMAGHGHFIELLADFGANCHLRNSASRAALDLAGTSEATLHNRDELRRVMLSVEPRLRTLLLYHEDCLEHSARRAEDWEGPDRLMGIMHRLQNREEFAEHEVEISSHFDKAPVELLSRVHSPEYIAFVDKLSKQMQLKSAAGAVVPFTPQVQKEVQGVTENQNIKKEEFCDTSFSAGTLQAARRAAGAVAFAVDRVLLGRNRNAFCCVRPPGHHAGYNGLLDNAKSCGFCIFNNVAAGAMHALEGHNCERVAIVDLDIHHGNGTEDIVRRYTTPSRLLFFSLHLYDKDLDPGYEFFPGSGSNDDASHNIINVPILPMWHSSGSTGTKTSTGSDAGSPVVNTTSSATNSPFSTGSPSHASAAGGRGPLTGREAYRQAIIQRLLPALRAFNPGLILLSTGFDPALGDVGNTRNMPILNPDGTAQPGSSEPAMGMDLTAEDFAWVTSEIMKIADICCAGRVVSVLEGGYGSYSAAARAQAQAKLAEGKRNNRTRGSEPKEVPAPLDRHILANSCSAHVHKLIDAYGQTDQHPLLCNPIDSAATAAGAIKKE